MFQFQRFKISNFYFQVIFSDGTVQQIYADFFSNFLDKSLAQCAEITARYMRT